jgi:hypothetical protein
VVVVPGRDGRHRTVDSRGRDRPPPRNRAADRSPVAVGVRRFSSRNPSRSPALPRSRRRRTNRWRRQRHDLSGSWYPGPRRFRIHDGERALAGPGPSPCGSTSVPPSPASAGRVTGLKRLHRQEAAGPEGCGPSPGSRRGRNKAAAERSGRMDGGAFPRLPAPVREVTGSPISRPAPQALR